MIDKQAIWENTFGTSGESFSWWREVTFLDDADWNKPGRVRLGIEHPDDASKTGVKTLGIDEIVAAAIKASETCVDPCTGSKIDVNGDDIDWDACVSDCVLQIAVLGEVVYG
jgi:hypothetical protein